MVPVAGTLGPPALPAGYNENVLVLLVQGPGVVFAYLELSEHFWGALMRQGRPVLHLYDASDGGAVPVSPVTQVDLPPFTTNWYFRNLTPGRTYVAELGWQDPEGVFVSLVRSNPAATPLRSPEPAGGPRRMTVAAAAPLPGWALGTEKEEPAVDLPSSYES